MQKRITIPYLIDPGHGYFSVPHELIVQAGIADKISHYSYMTHDRVYLEEDCDAPLLLHALSDLGYTIVKQGNPYWDERNAKADPKKTVNIRVSHSDRDAACRRYASYNKDALNAFQVGKKFKGIISGREAEVLIVRECTGKKAKIKNHFRILVEYKVPWDEKIPSVRDFIVRKVDIPNFFTAVIPTVQVPVGV